MPALHPGERGRRVASLAIRCLAAVPMVIDVTTGRPVATPEFEYVLLVLLHPLILRRGAGIELTLPQVLWVSGGVALHEFGMVYGLYGITWWDHLTHAVSGSLVAAAGYTAARADAVRAREARPTWWVEGASLGVLLVGAIGWELYERVTPDLMTYGALDTSADLAFGVLGWLLVAWLGHRTLERPARGLAARLPEPESPDASGSNSHPSGD